MYAILAGVQDMISLRIVFRLRVYTVSRACEGFRAHHPDHRDSRFREGATFRVRDRHLGTTDPHGWRAPK